MSKIKVTVDSSSGDQVAIFVDACRCGHEVRLTPQRIDPILLSIDGMLIDRDTAHELAVLLERFAVIGKLSHHIAFNNACSFSDVATAIKVARQEASDGHDPMLHSFDDVDFVGPNLAESLAYVQRNTKDPDMTTRCQRLLDAVDAVDPVGSVKAEPSKTAAPIWWAGYNSGPLVEVAKDEPRQPKIGDFQDRLPNLYLVPDVVRSKSEPDNPAIWRRDSDKGNASIFSMPDDDKDDAEVKVEEPKPETWRDRKPLL